jgi:hypothetical protein
VAWSPFYVMLRNIFFMQKKFWNICIKCCMKCEAFLRVRKYCHVSGVPWRIVTGCGLDDWIYWCLLCTISLNYNQYNVIADLLTSQITRTYYPFLGKGFITQKLSLQITMKSSWHFFFNPLGLPILQNSTQFFNSIHPGSWLFTPLCQSNLRVRVILWLTVYRQSIHLGEKPLETHDQ